MAQIVDHRDLISGYQPGDLPASERIVRVYQNEILRTAFLLTGSADGATTLARNTFLNYFRRLVRGDVPDDPRFGLLHQLGKTFNHDPDEEDQANGDRGARSLEGTVSYDAGPQRYRVEDQRSRVLSMLGLFDPPTRLGLVLRDFNALEEEPVCQILDVIPFTLRQQLHPARERLLSAAGVDANYSVRELLVNAATAAPRPNLWPDVIGPLEDIYAEEDERRQRLTYLAAAVVALLLIVAGLWLFDVYPFGGGDDSSAAAVATPEPTATATATPEPTITPTPIPALSSFAIPRGDVPGSIIMRINDWEFTPEATEYGFFDLANQTFSPYGSDGFAIPSPDGRLLVGLATDANAPADGGSLLVAVDSATGERVWESDRVRTVYSYAMTQDRVYLITRATAIVDGAQLEQPELREYDLETGERLREWQDLIPSTRAGFTSFIRIALFPSPANDRLYIGIDEFGSGPSQFATRSLLSYSLPEMTLESESIQTDSAVSPQFPTDFSFFDSYVTPDGAFLYHVDVAAEQIQFRSSDPDQDFDLTLPFTNGSSSDDLYWITSNDGRYLYLLAVNRAEIAIVDLLSRRVAMSFPLAFSEDLASHLVAFRNQQAVGSGFRAGLGLSLDGQRLYVIGFDDERSTGTVEQSFLWTIELETWTVVDFRVLRGAASSVSELDGSLIVMAFDGTTSGVFASQLLVLTSDASQRIDMFDGEGLPESSDTFFAFTLPELYRFTYRRAAAVDHRAFDDIDIASTLPRITMAATADRIPAGKSFDIAVRALNPADGQLITEFRPDVRFDVDSTIIIRLRHEEDDPDDEMILIANRNEPGLYLAGSTLTTVGIWNAEVTITGTDGQAWSRTFEHVVEIVPSWEASDGKRYALQLSADPSEPAVDQTVAIVARFVEIESGSSLPADEQILTAWPEEMRIIFDSSGQGIANATLVRNEQGSYEGEETFWAAGEWSATAEVQLVDGDAVRVGVGTVNVAP